MKSLDETLEEIDLSASEMSDWIDYNWVLPEIKNAVLYFSDADIARARMLKELIHDIGANDASIPVILRAMDQVYDLRKVLSSLTDAIQHLSVSARQELEQAIRDQQQEQNQGDFDCPPKVSYS